MSALDFTPFGKIARLNRDITVTEKIDGTNAAVVIVAEPFGGGTFPDRNRIAIIVNDSKRDESGKPDTEYHVYAQSRTRFITPTQDNYGFAGWVERNAEALVATLGEGTHFGEWWGSGIQRKYGLAGGDKRLSLFNTGRWAPFDGWASNPVNKAILESGIPGLGVVPVLYEGPFSQDAIDASLNQLRTYGSMAKRGFQRPEGIVVYHQAARQSFKVTLEGDQPTPQQRQAKHANDNERIAA